MKPIPTEREYNGLLVIGDPHLEGRVPGFRKDDYPRTILEKLRWALNYAATEKLLPLITGDLFNIPRNNPNWLLVEMLQLLDREVFFIYGNHDVHENAITDDDSISVLVEAGRGRLLGGNRMVSTVINSRPVLIGGTSWGAWIPEKVPDTIFSDTPPLAVWLTHHDIIVPGYEDKGWLKPREISGIDLVVNGHIHRCLETVIKGKTTWLTPGNIARRARSDATRAHTPAVLRIDIDRDGWKSAHIEVPHRPYDEVFHEAVLDAPAGETASGFVTGLAELQARRTQTGEGLMEFLNRNLDPFDRDVAEEILRLAKETINE